MTTLRAFIFFFKLQFFFLRHEFSRFKPNEPESHNYPSSLSHEYDRVVGISVEQAAAVQSDCQRKNVFFSQKAKNANDLDWSNFTRISNVIGLRGFGSSQRRRMGLKRVGYNEEDDSRHIYQIFSKMHEEK